MGVNSLPKTVAGQRRGCYLNPGPSAPESSTLQPLGYRATLSVYKWVEFNQLMTDWRSVSISFG